jgi:hypothetical protein
LEGFALLTEEEQANLKAIFQGNAETQEDDEDSPEADEVGPSQAKKPKLIDSPERSAKLKTQSDELWKVMDELRGRFSKGTIETLLRANGTYPFKKLGVEQQLELLADVIVFGAISPCNECGNKMLRYSDNDHGYKCCAFISEYTRCTGFIREVCGRFLSLNIPFLASA